MNAPFTPPTLLVSFISTASYQALVDALGAILDEMDNRVGMNPTNDFERDMASMRSALIGLEITFPSNMEAVDEAMRAVEYRRAGYY